MKGLKILLVVASGLAALAVGLGAQASAEHHANGEVAAQQAAADRG